MPALKTLPVTSHRCDSSYWSHYLTNILFYTYNVYECKLSSDISYIYINLEIKVIFNWKKEKGKVIPRDTAQDRGRCSPCCSYTQKANRGIAIVNVTCLPTNQQLAASTMLKRFTFLYKLSELNGGKSK